MSSFCFFNRGPFNWCYTVILKGDVTSDNGDSVTEPVFVGAQHIIQPLQTFLLQAAQMMVNLMLIFLGFHEIQNIMLVLMLQILLEQATGDNIELQHNSN